jgi:LPXTG-motif cell wall-anchored protein
MLRKIAAGTGAAIVAAGLAVAPAAAAGLSGPPADRCAEAATCVTVVPAVADFWAVKRKSSGPPSTGTPIPEVPSSPPPIDSGPGGPGPGGAPPPAPSPPAAGPAPAPAPAPDITQVPAPAPIEPVPPPTTAPAEPRRPSEAVRPAAEAPTRLPQTATDSRPLTVAGGGSLIAAGLAWMGGARRRNASGVSRPGRRR